MDSTTPVSEFDTAIRQWIKKNFTGNWQPSLAMVKQQVIDNYAIDTVNRFKEFDEKGGFSLLVNEYYAELEAALSQVSKERSVGSTEEL